MGGFGPYASLWLCVLWDPPFGAPGGGLQKNAKIHEAHFWCNVASLLKAVYRGYLLDCACCAFIHIPKN